MAKAILKGALGALAIVLAIDFIGFMFWVASGQHPVDEFFIGTITTHIIQALINL